MFAAWIRWVFAVGLMGIVLSACVGAAPVTIPAPTIEVVSGSDQSAEVGAKLALPFIAIVKDAKGEPLPDVNVVFEVASGGGTLSDTTVLTDANGEAMTTLTVGSKAGDNTVTASVPGLTKVPATFSATALERMAVMYLTHVKPIIDAQCVSCHRADGPAQFTPLTSYALVRYSISSIVADPLVVPGYPDASYLVQKLKPTGSMYAMLGADDATRAANAKTINDWILTGALNTPVGAASRIALVVGDNQSATVSTELPVPLAVRVLDDSDNPVPGVTVDFAVTSGGGTLSVQSVKSDAMGRAETHLSVGALVGANSVTASVAGMSSAVTFASTATAGAATQIAMVSGNNQTKTVATQLANPFVVAVKDMNGNPVSGFMVNFAVATGGGLLTTATALTNDAGQAQTTLTLGPTAGMNTVTVNAAGLTGSPMTFTATGTAGAAYQIALASGDNQSARVGTALSAPLAVVVQDAYGNPVAGRAVTFAVASGGGTLSATTATSNAQGLAMTTLTVGQTVGMNTVTASSAGLVGSPLTFTATGTTGTAATISLVSGNNQTATVGTALSPFVVGVADMYGNPVSGFMLTFAVTGGGGSLFVETVMTNAQGRAQTVLTLGPMAGANTVTANATGLTGSPVTFSATGTAGAATQIMLVSGNNQSATVGTALASPLVVVVRDALGNPVSGKAVTFAVASGGGTLSATSVTTNSVGVAQSTLTVGATAGSNTVTASAAGLTGSPITFTATGTAGAASQIALVSGNNQTATAGATLPSPFVVVVKDASGNPVSGTSVSFAIGTGGGMLSVASATTNAQGQAQTTLTLGTTVGANLVTASAAGLTGSPISFSATGTAGAAATLALVSGNNQSATISTALTMPLVVAVKDANGNAVSGTTVTFAATSGGGSLSATSVMTNASGQAQSALTLGSAAGNNTVTASVAGLTGSPVTFTATGTTGSATQILLVSGNDQTATAGATLPNAFVVAVKDAGGNPVSGFTVTFAVASGGGTLSAATTMTNASGLAQTTLTLGKTAGTNTVTANATGLTGSPVTFMATGTAGAATELAMVSGNNQAAKVSTALPLPLVVAVRDANGNPVSGKAVTFAVASGGGTLSATSVTTNLMGQAQTSLTLGATAGTNTVTATSAGLTGSPVTFTAIGSSGAASQIALLSGNDQSGIAGAALAMPFVVVVKDATGNPVSGFSVTFAVATGGGTLSAASATTNAQGQASTMLTLGKTAGANTVTANATGLTGSPVTFSATGTAGAATQLALASGNNQSGKVVTALASPFVVVVKDVNGNVVSGTSVSFAVASGGGSLSAASAMTNASGQAQTTLTLGSSAGANTVTASAAGLTGSPVTFTATGTAGTATQIALASGNNQTAAAGSTLSPFVVVVRDATGNPVSGFSVSFAVASGGGTLSAANATTNAQGQAQTTLTLGGTAGANTVTANAAGLTGSPITFTAMGTAGTATQMAMVSGNNQSAAVGTALANPLVVVAKDANGNPVSGVAVTFAVASGGGSVSATSATTDAQGQAQTMLTVGTTAGANTVTATRAGLTGSPITFTATATAGTPTALALVSGNNQTAKVSTALASPFVVSVKDASGNPVSGATVTFAVISGGGTLSATTATTNAQGQASSTLTLGPTVGTNRVTASLGALTPVTFTATSTSGTATQIAAVSGTGQTAAVGMALANPFIVVVKDSTGNPVSGFNVTFTVTAGGGSLSAASMTTNAMGQAQTTLTVGGLPGTNTVTANATGLTGSPVTFSATATVGAASTIAIVSGNNQSGRVGAPLASPLVVVVKDSFGNNVSGTVVTFAVTGGGGSISATSATTNAMGQAQTTLTVGAAPGPNTVTASVSGLTGSPLTFTAAARWITYEDDVKPILTARCINCHAAGGQASFTPLTTYTQVRFGVGFSNGAPLVVPNSPSASLLITKIISSGSMYANLGADTATRDANLKTINDWIAQGAFNTAVGNASQIVMTSGNNQSGSVSTNLTNPFVVTVMDANMNPVSGFNVTFAVTAGGGTLSATTVSTGSQGTAATTLKLGAAAGTNTVTANATGLTGSPVTFTATATAGSYSGAPLAGSTNPFDVAALVALKAANVEPAALATDGEFLRRVTADLAGRLPTLDEWTTFAASTDPAKRDAVIDQLLASADFGKHWGLDVLAAWMVIDRNDSNATDTDRINFENYLIDAATTDKPLSMVITELATGAGTGGAAFDVYNMQSGETYKATDRLMETFTGIPSKCARCHDSKIVSPLDDPQWTQAQNKGLYRFLEATPSGTLSFVVDGVSTNPTNLPLATDSLATRRSRFAQLLVASKAFPRGTGHRIFAEVMQPLMNSNRILAQEVANVKVPEILKACSSVFTAQNTSLKGFLRTLMRSKLYQLSTKGTTTTNDPIFARRTLRRHAAEVLQAGVVGVTGIVDSTTSRDDFLSKFGYAMDRSSITERSFAINTIQPLTLMNNPSSVPGKVTNTTGIIAGLASKVDTNAMTLDAAITEIFRRALTRDPTAAELTALKNELATATTNKERLEDVAAVVMASTEFATR